MSSVSYHEDNYEKYDCALADEEWSVPWGGTRSMWLTSIFPRIGQFLPADRIVEIGCGYGKIAKVLHAFTASELVLLDITDDCIEKCALAFEESSKTRCLKTDGRSLQGVANNSVDLVFSFYSLVDTNVDNLNSYLKECERALRNDGAAFLHHSNLGMYYQEKNSQVDKRVYSLAAERDILIDAAKVQDMAADSNLICIKQECINWDIEEVLSDCFSTLVRPDSKWAQAPELIHNPDFHNERKLAAKRIHEKRIVTDESWRII
ncbi:MAG: methyltransferase domain-containing protein [Gammaproteobacteria bacterium]